MEVVIKLKVNTESNEVQLIGAEEVNSVKITQAKPASKSRQKKQSTEKAAVASSSGLPEIILEENRLVFTDEALDLLELDEGDKIHIKYNQKDGVKTPIIGLNSEFGVKAGNVLNKNKTVSWRGQKNEQLSEFGEVFILKPFDNKDNANLFVLVDSSEEEAEVEVGLSTSKKKSGINVSMDKNVKPINDTEEVDLELPSDIEVDPNSDTISLDDLDELIDVNILDLEL